MKPQFKTVNFQREEIRRWSLYRCELDMPVYRFKVIFNYFYVKRRFLYQTKPNLEKDPKMPGVFRIHRWNPQDRSHHGCANQCFTSRWIKTENRLIIIHKITTTLQLVKRIFNYQRFTRIFNFLKNYHSI